MVLVPMLIRFAGLEDKKAFSSAISIILPLSLVSIFVYWTKQIFPIGDALPYLFGGLIGGVLGMLLFRFPYAAMVGALVGITALILLVPKVFRIFDYSFKLMDKLNNTVQENIHGIRVVKSFVREEKETEKFTGISSELAGNFSKAEKILALNSPIMQFCIYGCMLAISWFGAHMVVASGNNPDLGLTTGQLSSMFTYTTQILSGLMMLSMVFVMMTMSRTPLRRCSELLAEEADIVSPENPVMEVADGSIDFENVSFRYSATAQHRALKEVNLTIPSGTMSGSSISGLNSRSKALTFSSPDRSVDISRSTVLSFAIFITSKHGIYKL